MKTPIFTGAAVAIATPFANGVIDYKALDSLLDFQLANRTDAIVICGTTGESSTMSDEEHHACIAHTIDYVNHRVPVIAGTGSNDTNYAIDLSVRAAKAGADGLLLVTPYYNKCTQRGVIAHYNAIVDAAGIPAIVYNVPSRTGFGMTVETYAALSEHPLLNGVKEASGNLQLVARTIAACGDRFNVWSGNDDQIAPMTALGGKGIISVMANIIPKQTAEIAHACLRGDYTTGGKMQCDMMELIDALFCEVNPIPVKTALNLMGFAAGELRMPLCEMEPKNLERLKTAMQNFGLSV
ncbi:MAG: 4-hydroxy-tetrahydrodipicolinate synthase [Oscillospiraceae bacterium]|nr:4-hydroxy-tetrahydrodipicolinate synthase [Oscillospiraceae bacterium]